MVFADEATTLRHARRIERLHAPLEGLHRDGTPWSAADPEALSWVLVTLVDATLRGAELVQGRFSDGDVARYLDEARRFGALFAVRPEDVPSTRAALANRIAKEVRDVLVVGDETRAMWRFLTTPSTRSPLDVARARMLTHWAGATLPPAIARALGAPRRAAPSVRSFARNVGALVRALPPALRFTSRFRAALA